MEGAFFCTYWLADSYWCGVYMLYLEVLKIICRFDVCLSSETAQLTASIVLTQPV